MANSNLISIRLLLFGQIADLVGTRELTIDTDLAPLSNLLDSVVAANPRLTSRTLLVSINQEYATGDEIICDGDEVAIFTPVSGG